MAGSLVLRFCSTGRPGDNVSGFLSWKLCHGRRGRRGGWVDHGEQVVDGFGEGRGGLLGVFFGLFPFFGECCPVGSCDCVFFLDLEVQESDADHLGGDGCDGEEAVVVFACVGELDVGEGEGFADFVAEPFDELAEFVLVNGLGIAFFVAGGEDFGESLGFFLGNLVVDGELAFDDGDAAFGEGEFFFAAW